MLETWVRSLGWKDPLEEDMATYSSARAWRIPMRNRTWWATVHGVAKRHSWATKRKHIMCQMLFYVLGTQTQICLKKKTSFKKLWVHHDISKYDQLYSHKVAVCVYAQSCWTFCNSMDCSLPDFFLHGDSPGKNTGVGCHFLLQGIVSTQGSNSSLLHWQVNSLPLHHLGSPFKGYSVKFSSVTQSCLTLCDPMNCSTSDLIIAGNRKQLSRRTMETAEGRWSTCDQRHMKWWFSCD